MGDRVRALIAWGSRLGQDFTRTRASLAAGGLAYFVALSLAPAALAFGTIAGLILDPQDVREVLDRMADRTPEAAVGTQAIVDALVSTVESASASAVSITAVVSALIAIYASSKVVLGVRMSMNSIFGVVETRSGLLERGIATVVTLVGIVLGVAVVVLLTFVPKILQWLGVSDVPVLTGNGALEWTVAVVIVFLAARWIMNHAPNGARRVPWTSPGPLVATAGVVAATVGVGLYVRFSSSLSAAILVFGTAVVILLWLYLCFLALMWGAIIEADRQRPEADEAPSPASA